MDLGATVVGQRVTVEPRFKHNMGECEGNRDRCTGDTCPIYGTYQARTFVDGRRRVRGCDDPAARGRRNRTKGDAKARRARKGLRIAGANTRHEELWAGAVLTEMKAGGKAKTVQTAYENARQQSDAARPIGKIDPFVAGFCPDNTRHTYYVIRDDDIEAAVFALAEMWGYGGGGA